jgi:YD repeat-containing protein
LVSSTDALTNTTTYTYVSGLLQISIDVLNRVTTYGYDTLRRLVTITNPLNETTTYTYDTAGNVSAVTDALNRTTTYSYDAMGWTTVVEDALGNKTTTTYDAAGQVLTRSEFSLSYNVQERGQDALCKAHEAAIQRKEKAVIVAARKSKAG